MVKKRINSVSKGLEMFCIFVEKMGKMLVLVSMYGNGNKNVPNQRVKLTAVFAGRMPFKS